MEGAMLACNNVNNDKWSKKEAKQYLRTFGINDALSKKIFKAVSEGIDITEVLPAKWKHHTGLLMLNHIDPIMHLIFYGVVASTIEELQLFLSKRKKHSNFKRITNILIDKIIELKLSWCKILPYKEGTFGGWIAENWIAFMRITKWLTSEIHFIAGNTEYEKPAGEIKTWKKPTLRYWCDWHGFKYGKQNKKQLQKYVLDINKDSSIENAIVSQPGGDVKNIMNLIVSLNTMVALIMQPEIDETLINHCECSIKIYLTIVELVNSNLRDKGEIPIWINKSNYMSLLNLPRQMKEFGPLRLYWEGGWKGEGIIQELKPLIRNRFQKNWSKNTLKRLYNLRAFDYLLETNNLIYESPTSDGNYRSYKSFENIIENIEKHNAISVIITVQNEHLISINNNQCIKIFKKDLHAVKYKMGYYYWTIDNKSETNEFPQENTIKEYGILLPWYDVDTQSNVIYNITPSYTCITSSWMELSEEGYNIPMNVGKEDI